MARAPLTVLASLFRRAGVSLRAGVDMMRTWEIELSRGSARHREHMRTIHDRIRAGDSVFEALEACDEYFPVMAREMIRVGERTGRLEAVLIRLAEHYEHLVHMRREFLNSIWRPMTQLVIAIAVIGLLIWIMGLMPGGVDMLGFGLRGTGGLIVYLLIVASLAGGVWLAIYSLWRGWWGAAPILVAMKVPVIGPVLETMALTRYTWTLGVAADSGMDVREAMQLSLRSTHNPVYLSQEAVCDEQLRRGQEFHEAMQATGVFPGELVDTVQTGELAGTLSESLMHASRDYEERAKLAAQTLARFAAGAVWLLVAIFIIFMIFRLASVYFGALNEALEFTR